MEYQKKLEILLKWDEKLEKNGISVHVKRNMDIIDVDENENIFIQGFRVTNPESSEHCLVVGVLDNFVKVESKKYKWTHVLLPRDKYPLVKTKFARGPERNWYHTEPTTDYKAYDVIVVKAKTIIKTFLY